MRIGKISLMIVKKLFWLMPLNQQPYVHMIWDLFWSRELEICHKKNLNSF